MNEIHYLISDASKKVDVEAHVLRYWEEELKLDIPRNEMGHRYYTEVHIRLFRQVKALKEKGYQLKAIKSALDRIIESGKDLIISDEVLEEDMEKALKKCAGESDQKAAEQGTNKMEKGAQEENVVENSGTIVTEEDGTDLIRYPEIEAGEVAAGLTPEEKMEQFQEIMNHIIGRALEANNEKLSQDISQMVNDKVSKDMEYLFQVSNEKEEERFKRLDEVIRTYQKENRGRAEAAAAKVPFFKKRDFGRKENRKIACPTAWEPRSDRLFAGLRGRQRYFWRLQAFTKALNISPAAFWVEKRNSGCH